MTLALHTHPTDDELVLHYYGEGSDAETTLIQVHLASCPACAATFEEIASTLSMVEEMPVPARGDRYGLEVWQRLRAELPANRPLTWWPRHTWQVLSLAAAAVVLIVGAFFLGRSSRSETPSLARSAGAVAVPGADQRVRLAALADHLEQSERVLLDLSNSDWVRNVSLQQAWAEDLVDANRLHREAAVQAGDSNVAGVLDDLERMLLDIVHTPSTLTPAELAAVRARLDAAALLFKVRVLSNELRDQESVPALPRKTT